MSYTGIDGWNTQLLTAKKKIKKEVQGGEITVMIALREA